MNSKTLTGPTALSLRRSFYWASVFLIAGEFITVRPSLAQSNPASAASRYRRRQRAAYEKAWSVYTKARDTVEAEASQYWRQIHVQQSVRRDKRAAGQAILEADYVTVQPPEYAGPPAPKNRL
jgi:hypothetical protein